MLERPAVSDAAITACLCSEFGLQDVALAFLPVGADLSTAAYRVTSRDGSHYFAKVRFGQYDEVSALLPRWLVEQGIAEVLAPLPSRTGLAWASAEGFTLLLYPFVEGRDAYQAVLSDEQWQTFGESLRAVHEAVPPQALASRIPQETYTLRWRDQLRRWVGQVARDFDDPVAQRFAIFLRDRQAQVVDLVERTDLLGEILHGSALPPVVCHTDLHAGNLLLANDGRLFIVDWDAPLLAPRERDLMYPGGGQGFLGREPHAEEALFYRGYGTVEVDARALAYYRLERIVEDLAIFCGQLLGTGDTAAGSGQSDREQALRWAMSNFEPGGVLEIAYRTGWG